MSKLFGLKQIISNYFYQREFYGYMKICKATCSNLQVSLCSKDCIHFQLIPAARKEDLKVFVSLDQVQRTFLFSAEKRLKTKDETSASESDSQQHFVRAYRDRNGCFNKSSRAGMRMSVAIRPQTVANLASKFDSIINEKPACKTSESSSSRQLKLRTYDINKIITELNKLNSGDQSKKPSNSDKVGGRNFAKSGVANGEKSINSPQNSRCDEKVINLQQFSRVDSGKTTVSVGRCDKSSEVCGDASNILEQSHDGKKTDAKTGKNIIVALS